MKYYLKFNKLTYLPFLLIMFWNCQQMPVVQKEKTDIESYLYSNRPMPMDTVNSLQYKWDHKEIMDSIIVDHMESLDDWEMTTVVGKKNVAAITLSKERVYEGNTAIKFVSPTKLPFKLKDGQRYWEWQLLTRKFNKQDFSKYNRISVQIYPEFKGHRKLYLMMILHNEGNVPDKYFRDGIHTFMLKNYQWNKVVMEIPHLPHDKVTGISLVYRLQGNECDAADTITYYADKLAFESVKVDHYEGWDTSDAISFCHTGYNLESKKTAFTSLTDIKKFKIINLVTNKIVLEKKAATQTSQVGTFTVFDFSEIKTPGVYKIIAGNIESKSFPIRNDVWLPSLEKTINLFFTERCGYELPGIHKVCHSDWYTIFKGDTIPMNGGWHDAGDLSQSYANTSEAVGILFKLARKYQLKNEKLSKRLIEEGMWGLNWLHKNRFAAGQRIYWTTIDNWSDGKIGNFDDLQSPRTSIKNDIYYGILADAEASQTIKTIDPKLAEKCKQFAIEDWQLVEKENGRWNTERLSLALMAGVKLVELTGSQQIKNEIIDYADQLMACQQKELMKWKIPLNGFFYKDKTSSILFGYKHHVFVASPIIGIVELCRLFPKHEKYPHWFESVQLYAKYLRSISQITGPYHMIPANVYKLGTDEDVQIKNGIKMDENYYLRMFPVWQQFRGNTAIELSHGIGLAYANQLLKDPELKSICQSQLEWIVGKNPFNQSLMFGEGYDFAPQYSVMCGDIVGGLPVGILTNGDRDVPYWQASVFCNYKEIWVHPSTRWLELLESIN
jgi:hypothetical protein